jgi:hypothetical protein
MQREKRHAEKGLVMKTVWIAFAALCFVQSTLQAAEEPEARASARRAGWRGRREPPCGSG